MSSSGEEGATELLLFDDFEMAFGRHAHRRAFSYPRPGCSSSGEERVFELEREQLRLGDAAGADDAEVLAAGRAQHEPFGVLGRGLTGRLRQASLAPLDRVHPADRTVALGGNRRMLMFTA